MEEEPENIAAHGWKGIALALMGDQDGAEAEARWCEDLDRPHLRGGNTYFRAAIMAYLNRKQEVVSLLRQALQEGETYYALFCDQAVIPLWDYGPFQELVSPKG